MKPKRLRKFWIKEEIWPCLWTNIQRMKVWLEYGIAYSESFN